MQTESDLDNTKNAELSLLVKIGKAPVGMRVQTNIQDMDLLEEEEENPQEFTENVECQKYDLDWDQTEGGWPTTDKEEQLDWHHFCTEINDQDADSREAL